MRALEIAVFAATNHLLVFAAFAERWLTEYLPGRALKRTTTKNYTSVVRGHLLPCFGSLKLSEVERRPELVDRYIAAKASKGLSPKTITNQLIVLQGMLKLAMRWRLIARTWSWKP